MVKLTLIDDDVTTNEMPAQSKKHIPTGPKLKLDEEGLPKENPYYVEEKTPEDIKGMSMQQRREYADDLKRQREYLHSRSLGKGLLSGASFGLSERAEALKPNSYEPGSSALVGQAIGSFAPIAGLFEAATIPTLWLASKSPVFVNQLKALARLTGAFEAGAAHEGITKVAKDEEISPDDMVAHGAEWAAIDGALGVLGVAGKFGKSIIRSARKSNVSPQRIVRNVTEELASRNVDLSQPQRVADEAFKILEKEPEIATKAIKLPQKAEASKPEMVSRNILGETRSEGVSPALGDRKISQKNIPQTFENLVQLSEPYIPEGLEAANLIGEIETQSLADELETIGVREPSRQQLGKRIQQDVNDAFVEAKESYEPLYKAVENGAKNIEHSPKKTIDVALNILERINSLKTRPTQYATVIKTIEDSLEDMGYQVVKSGKKLILKDASGQEVKVFKNIPVSKSLELKRRLNEIIDYDIDAPRIKKSLKPIVGSLKEDINQTLHKAAPFLQKTYQIAEEGYGATARKFGRENIQKARSSEAGEKIANLINNPTGLEDLRKVLPARTYSAIERELLEDLKSQNFQTAMKNFREMEAHLSRPGQALGRKILKEKQPSRIAAPSRHERLHTAIRGDLQKSLELGQRPDRVLNLWKTEKGQAEIKKALKDVPNRTEVLEYLEKQSFYDFGRSIVDTDSSINFAKLKKHMSNPATRENLRLIGGEDAVRLFDNLGHYQEQLSLKKMLFDQLNVAEKSQLGEHILNKYAARKSKLPKEQQVALDKLKTKTGEVNAYGKERLKKMARTEAPIKFAMKDFLDAIGIPGKTAIAILAPLSIGLGPSSLAATALYSMYKLASKRNVQKAFKNAVSSPRSDPVKFFTAIEVLGEALEED